MNLVDKDKREMLEGTWTRLMPRLTLIALRESVKSDVGQVDSDLAELKDQVAALKDKDRMHLEEIKR